MKHFSATRPAPTTQHTRQKVLLLSADRALKNKLDQDFDQRGFQLVTMSRPKDALREVRRGAMDAVIVNMSGPGDDGLALVREFRENSPVPILAIIDTTEDVVEIIALKYGADLVVSRSASSMLIAERFAALLRRNHLAGPGGETKLGRFERGALSIEIDKMRASWKGKPVEMTRIEFHLLRFLAERPGYMRTRDQIHDEIYGGAIHVLDRSIDSHIKRIRGKFRKIDPRFDAIETVYGVGYRYTDDTARQAA